MENYNKNTYGKRLSISDIYRNIGAAHHSTLQTIPINKENIQKDFKKYYDSCIEYQKRFEQYIDEFEQKRYMAPVELLICTHYRDIDYIVRELLNRLDQFNSEILKVSEWRYCLCYGQNNIKNLLVKGNLYQSSQTDYFHANAVLDIVSMIKCQLYNLDLGTTNLSEYFTLYRKENSLVQIEKELLAIYLLDPTEYFQTVEGYATRTTDQSMMEYIMVLKRNQRFLLQMVDWSRNNLNLESNDDTD
ncbi:hypothetical protein [Virgibacillus sp. DJP39]|uniref:hypothetical protein n=1 Tax=Virgibacillus sp. DJP39 TaxID=3409790 RepID=UPI003BB689B4